MSPHRVRVRRGAAWTVFAALCVVVGTASAARGQDRRDERTRVVVLGVSHSTQLLSEAYQPAVFRAFFARVRPDAIAVERDPGSMARGSHHEFTYEIQHIVLPWAAEHRVPVYPFDWQPDPADELLAFGTTWSPPPTVRQRGALQNFLTFRDSTALGLKLFFADGDSARKDYRDWYDAVPQRAGTDFARRLFLYRTFLQARRVAEAAARHPGGTLLVLAGAFHKEDIERILADDPRFRVVQPATFGHPRREEVEREVRDADLYAVAAYNLLGAQPSRGPVDWAWMGRVMHRLGQGRDTPELALLRARLAVLTGALTPDSAVRRYEAVARQPGAAGRFTWSGVLDGARLDSYYDPFGNLTIAQRARLEAAREHLKAGREERAEELRRELESSLTLVQRAQLHAYWEEHLVRGK